jgi:DNA-directed RNA polymerase II subunit RPB2
MDDIKNEISWSTIDKMFCDNPNFLIKHHLDSYNNFFKKGIKNIFRDNNPINIFKKKIEKGKGDEKDEYLYKMQIYLGGKNGHKLYYGKPVIHIKNDEGNIIEQYMYPNQARLKNLTYSFTVHYDIDIIFTRLIKNTDNTNPKKYNTEIEEITLEKIYLGKFPIMLGSDQCILKNMNKEVRYQMGECKNESGGYFIIDGKEKLIMSQESRADNQLYITKKNDRYNYSAEIRSVSEDASKPIRTLKVLMVAPLITLPNGQIEILVPNVRKPVPLFILMRALGVISDENIIKTCLLDMKLNEDLIELFRPSIHDAGQVYTQQSALLWIGSFLKVATASIPKVLSILMIYFLPHIGELNFYHKALYLGYIVKRLLFVSSKKDKITDRDSYAYKRILVSGTLIQELFREYYLMQIKDIYLKMDSQYEFKQSLYQNEKFINLIQNNQNLIFKNRIVEEGFRKAFKGNWGAASHTKRLGAVQDFNRLSFFSALCQLRKTNLPLGDSAKIIAPRLLHSTQIGLLCPLHSPDGGNIGLHKHLSTSTFITKGESSIPYFHYLRGRCGMKILEECSFDFIAKTTKVFLNGAWVGCHTNPIVCVDFIKNHRRNNMIGIFTSVHFDFKRNEIIILTDSGRPLRPLYYMMNDENKLMSYERTNILELYKNNNINWNNIINGLNKEDKKESIQLKPKSQKDFIKNSSVVEFIDTQEAQGIVLAHSEIKRKDFIKNRITHEEIHPSLLLGIMANQIIYPENNPYPRNAFSCGQAKQGVSMYHSNFRNRVDKTSLMLNSGQIPLTKTRYFKYATNNQHPYGENAIVAIMCYSGYNVEDAVIINQGSLDRGLFRTTKYAVYEGHETTEGIQNNKITNSETFLNIEHNNVNGIKPGYDYSNLDKKSGIIKEGSIINEKTVLIGKATGDPRVEDTYIDSSITARKGDTGIIEKSFMTSGLEGKRVAKVKIRSERIPAIGDKFCSRAGQKGTIGIILPEADMPTTRDGIKPDIIVNPHAMPSRMTIGHLVETITSKVGAIFGGFTDCTAFQKKGSVHELFGQYLSKAGYHKSGCEILYNGMTGEQLDSEIYFGPTYYLRLKHMPKDKINYRGRGPRQALTRQTVQGRANNGGLRVGEMDRDCLIAHGMTHFIKESMMVRGDQYKMAVCNKSGCIAVYNPKKQIFLSPLADGPIQFNIKSSTEANLININRHGRDFSIVEVPYCFKLLLQELKTMNIQMRIVTDDNVDQLMSLKYGLKDHITKLTGNPKADIKSIQSLINEKRNKLSQKKWKSDWMKKSNHVEENYEDQQVSAENELEKWAGNMDFNFTLPENNTMSTAQSNDPNAFKTFVEHDIFKINTLVSIAPDFTSGEAKYTEDEMNYHYNIIEVWKEPNWADDDGSDIVKIKARYMDNNNIEKEMVFDENEIEIVEPGFKVGDTVTCKVPDCNGFWTIQTIEGDGDDIDVVIKQQKEDGTFTTDLVGIGEIDIVRPESPEYSPFSPQYSPTDPQVNFTGQNNFRPISSGPMGGPMSFQNNNDDSVWGGGGKSPQDELDFDEDSDDEKPKIKIKILEDVDEIGLDKLLPEKENDGEEKENGDNFKKPIKISLN